MKRIAVAGDIHANVKWLTKLVKLSARNGCEDLLQAGDLGFWPRQKTASKRSQLDFMIEEVDKACERFGLRRVVFIAGNHDDHEELAKLMPDASGLVSLSNRLFYAPQATVFTSGSIRFGVLSGAVSVDAWLEKSGVELTGAPYREGWDWFPDLESPTQAAVTELSRQPFDVLLSHEAPSAIDFGAKGGFVLPSDISEKALAARLLVDQVLSNNTPRWNFHGHWHQRRTTTLAATTVESLAADCPASGRSWGVLDVARDVFVDGDHLHLLAST